jgi:hypothetical protein
VDVADAVVVEVDVVVVAPVVEAETADDAAGTVVVTTVVTEDVVSPAPPPHADTPNRTTATRTRRRHIIGSALTAPSTTRLMGVEWAVSCESAREPPAGEHCLRRGC